MANKTKLFDCENTPIPLVCKTVSQLIEAGTEISQLPPYCGLMHTRVMGPEIEYKVGSSDTKITNEGADIVLGTDRPDSVGSGFGGLGAQKANTIDLVVGRMASTRKGKGPTPSSKVDNSFVSDAARIYISQLTNVDTSRRCTRCTRWRTKFSWWCNKSSSTLNRTNCRQLSIIHHWYKHIAANSIR